MMRVLHLGKFAFVGHGGIERHVEELAIGLAEAGVDVCCLSYRSGEARKAIPLPARLQVLPCDVALTIANQPLSWTLLRTLRRVCSTWKPDLIHVHLPDPFVHLAVSLVAGRVPVVASWHSDIVRQRSLATVYGWLAAWALKRFTRVIGATPAHIASAQIPPYIGTDQKVVIPYGFDLSTFAAIPERYATDVAPGGDIRVLAVGRLVGYKGFEVLIDAARHVPGIQVDIVGLGPLYNTLQRQIALAGVGDRVHLRGEVDDRKLVELYRDADVFCLPSVSQAEAFGIVQVEAMAAGLPVVNTQLDNGVNVVSLAGETGLTVPPSDPEALAAALARLAGDSSLRLRLGRAARARALSLFVREAMTTAMLEVYRRVCAGEGASAGTMRGGGQEVPKRP